MKRRTEPRFSIGLSEFAMIALICAGALVIARAALNTAIALPVLLGS